MLTFDNKMDVEVEFRLSRANNAFYASWDLLGCVSVPLSKRILIFKAAVDASVFLVRGILEFDRGAP